MFRYILAFFFASGLVWAANYNVRDIRVIPNTTGNRPTGTAGQIYTNSTLDRIQYRSSGSSWYNLVGPATADTFTNKTFDADATGNALSNIENADIKTGAAITRSKLATGTNYRILANDASGVISENAALTANRPVISDTNGQLTTEAALSADRGGTGVANNAAATLTRSGNHALTLTTTNTTSLTLPTTGTVATLSDISAQVETIQRKGANYTLLTTDNILLADTSGGSWIATLPAGFTGKTYEITKISDDFLPVSVKPNGSETIVEEGTSSTSTALHTKGEYLKIAWDGARWQVMKRETTTQWTIYSITGSAGTSGFGTISSSFARWRRVGNSIEINAFWVNGTVTADEARVAFPSIGSQYPVTNASTVVTTIVGIQGNGNTSTSNNFNVICSPSERYFKMNRQNGVSGFAASPGNAYNNSESMSVEGNCPIAGWN